MCSHRFGHHWEALSIFPCKQRARFSRMWQIWKRNAVWKHCLFIHSRIRHRLQMQAPSIVFLYKTQASGGSSVNQLLIQFALQVSQCCFDREGDLVHWRVQHCGCQPKLLCSEISECVQYRGWWVEGDFNRVSHYVRMSMSTIFEIISWQCWCTQKNICWWNTPVPLYLSWAISTLTQKNGKPWTRPSEQSFKKRAKRVKDRLYLVTLWMSNWRDPYE